MHNVSWTKVEHLPPVDRVSIALTITRWRKFCDERWQRNRFFRESSADWRSMQILNFVKMKLSVQQTRGKKNECICGKTMKRVSEWSKKRVSIKVFCREGMFVYERERERERESIVCQEMFPWDRKSFLLTKILASPISTPSVNVINVFHKFRQNWFDAKLDGRLLEKRKKELESIDETCTLGGLSGVKSLGLCFRNILKNDGQWLWFSW